jgi:SAM-dependent methyltransferase
MTTTDVEDVVATHPQVDRAVVVNRVGYVIPADGADEHVAQWRRVYDDMYSEEEFADDPGPGRLGSDFIGWNSSYTGEPIPLEEMLQWRAASVERVRGLHPSRVLEIGVGSGLLLSQLAGDCEEYRGTDFSRVTISKLRARLKQADVPWSGRVHLRVAEAAETDRLPAGYFDTVIINSVAMCFPGHGYLRRVTEQALRVLAPGGTFYLGDIRNLTLLEQFSAAVHLARDPSADPATLHDRTRQAVAEEDELMLAPEYFVATARELPEIAGVDIQLKRGTAINELTRYRYDVVLHKGPAPVRSLAGAARVEFTGDLASILADHPGGDLRVTGIPHRGLVGEEATAEHIRRAEPVTPATVQGWLPEDVHLLAERLGRTAVVTWSARPDQMDAVFLDPEAPADALTDVYEPREPLQRASRYANYPQAAALSDDVRKFVAERVPADQVPAAVVIVDEFPSTVDGELDSEALPTPDLPA